MNPQEAGNYIADVINKNRQSGETNNQVLTRLLQQMLRIIKDHCDPRYQDFYTEEEYEIVELFENFDFTNLYKRKN